MSEVGENTKREGEIENKEIGLGCIPVANGVDLRASDLKLYRNDSDYRNTLFIYL